MSAVSRSRGRQRQHFLEDAVHAAAHDDFQLVGLDVDVGGPGHDRVLDDPVNQLDRRRLDHPGAARTAYARGFVTSRPFEELAHVALVEQVRP
jgi:hypothetical protein